MKPVKQNTSQPIVREIMVEFARETGLSPASSAPRRYLWTDAFAVCNFLGLYQATGGKEFKDLALQLVDQVHGTLGRHRGDDSRTGWISGLDEEQGKRHPTRGGLRIGKYLQERGSSEPFDEDLEWDRDGQYYHYLTKWMHALNCVSKATGDIKYNTWAVELAKTAHATFVRTSRHGGPKTMCWKMSIDLSRPLVRSMGQHDPLDGLVTYNELQATAGKADEESISKNLRAEILDMAHLCQGRSWVTNDPLGIGGLLFDACRVAQLIVSGNLEQTDLLETLLESSQIGLESFVRENSLRLPADYRLAFRELGLSIGLRALEKIWELIDQKSPRFRNKESLNSLLNILDRHAGLLQKIERFWLEGKNRKTGIYTTHHDINEVMLATSLAPDGFLEL
ncbi:MAG TPA: hypothetical protein VMV04_02875 [Thermodesulfobacteriota bacterium]|nr:hypothetical protein [Thermodesulfobacteriota bacterium]